MGPIGLSTNINGFDGIAHDVLTRQSRKLVLE